MFFVAASVEAAEAASLCGGQHRAKGAHTAKKSAVCHTQIHATEGWSTFLPRVSIVLFNVVPCPPSRAVFSHARAREGGLKRGVCIPVRKTRDTQILDVTITQAAGTWMNAYTWMKEVCSGYEEGTSTGNGGFPPTLHPKGGPRLPPQTPQPLITCVASIMWARAHA